MTGIGLNNYMAINPYMASAGLMTGNPMMANSYLNFKNGKDMKTYYNTQIDDAQAGIYANGQGRVSQRAYQIAAQLQGALKDENDTEVRRILESTQGDKYQLAGVEMAYGQMSGNRLALREDMREGLEGSKLLERIGLSSVNSFLHNIKSSILAPFGYNPINQREAFDILNEGATVNTTVAANALKEATEGIGIDKKTVNYVMGNTDGRMAEIAASYNQMGNLSADIRNSYNPFIDGFSTKERLNGQIASELV